MRRRDFAFALGTVLLASCAVRAANYPPVPMYAGDSIVIGNDTQDDVTMMLKADCSARGSCNIWQEVVTQIVAWKTPYSIKAYVSVGDVVNGYADSEPNTTAEYNAVRPYYDQMWAAGIPVIFCPGNHDELYPYSNPGGPYRAFAASFLADKPYFLHTRNAAYTEMLFQIQINGKDVLIVTMGNTWPDSGATERTWANGVINAWITGGSYGTYTASGAHPTGTVWVLQHELWSPDGTISYGSYTYCYQNWIAGSSLPLSLYLSGHWYLSVDQFAHKTLPRGTGYIHTLQANYQQSGQTPEYWSPGTFVMMTFAPSGWTLAGAYKATSFTAAKLPPAVGWLGVGSNLMGRWNLAHDYVEWWDPVFATGTYRRRFLIGR